MCLSRYLELLKEEEGIMEFLLFIFIVILIVVFVAWINAINLYLAALAEKGYELDNSVRGKIWLIGLFATPIAAGLYVASLPDRSQQPSSKTNIESIPSDNTLPTL